jgi:hypothetical protein
MEGGAQHGHFSAAICVIPISADRGKIPPSLDEFVVSVHQWPIRRGSA